LLFGHLVGDYLLQNKGMAMNKSGSTFRCAVHCVIYTLAVSLFTWPILHGWLWALLIFASHFPIDRWSLADKWLSFINGRSLSDYLEKGKHGIPCQFNAENYHVLRGGFTAVVYAVTDNTLHLLLMWYGAKLLLMGF